MHTILREERYIIVIGPQQHLLRIQELLSGPERWPGAFRLVLAASHYHKAHTFHGCSALDVATDAARYLSSHLGEDPMFSSGIKRVRPGRTHSAA